MSFFTAKKSKEALEQNSGGKFINKSGCYPVNLIAPFVSVSRNGSTSIDLFLDHKEQNQVLYGNMRITNNDGSENKIGAKVFNQLVIISGAENIDDPIDAELPIGKKEALKDVGVLEDLSDIDVIVRVQMEYSVHAGSIQEVKAIRGFFRAEDFASAEEIVNETEAGVQYKKEEQYFDLVTYKDGLDEAAVTEWIAKKRPKNTAGSASGAASPGKKPNFSKKAGFGAK